MAQWYDDVHAVQKYRLGTRQKSKAGNEYVYLKGVTNCADGSWVVVAASWAPALAIADLQGMVAIANAAVDATTKFGWFTVWGVETALCLASFDGTNGAGTYLTGTAGSVDDTDVAGDAVHNAIGLTDRDTTTGMSSFQVSYPFVLDLATD
jgi:hypothetical protein